nr:MAG TPA: hypothetical protein [Caudoviricetes sp.]
MPSVRVLILFNLEFSLNSALYNINICAFFISRQVTYQRLCQYRYVSDYI